MLKVLGELRCWGAVFFLLTLLVPDCVRGDDGVTAPLIPGAKGEVRETFDGRSFSYEIVKVEEKENCRVVHLRYPSPVETDFVPNNTIPVEYYLPKTAQEVSLRRPAVICLHILDGSLELVRMLGSVLASRGVAAVVFPLPYYGERGGPQGPRDILRDAGRFVSVLEQTFLEVRRAADFLASRPEIDPQKIGAAGISLGAIVAASSAEREPRIHRVGLILSGGNLPRILATAREAEPIREFLAKLPEEERQRVLEGFGQADPLTMAHLLRERALAGRVLMINAEDDEVIPREATEQLAEALGIKDRIVWLKNLGHYTAIAALPEILDQTAAFFAQDLPPEGRVQQTVQAETSPVNRVATLLRQVTQLYLEEPAPGMCHIVQVSATFNNEAVDVLFIRGRGGQFRLEVAHPRLGRVAAGQGAYPWMVARNGQVFAGEPDSPLQTKSPLTYVNGALLERVRFGALALGGLAGAPAALEPLVRISEEISGDDRILTVRLVGNNDFDITLVYRGDRLLPREIGVKGEGQSASLLVQSWQLNAPAASALFAPPAGAPTQAVSRNDLYRMFGALMNYAAELIP